VDPSPWRKRKMKGKRDRKRIGVVLCCLVTILLAGCATTRGVGQDTQSLGRDIEKIGK
jgi:predicted small secreted protein